MNVLKMAIRDDRREFKPGDRLEGVAGWQLDQPPKTASVQLLYHTRGKGTEDVVVVEVFSFDNPQQEEARAFHFQLPDKPYSFSGSLISLIWTLELVTSPPDDSARLEFILSPTGQEIVLGRLETPKWPKWK